MALHVEDLWKEFVKVPRIPGKKYTVLGGEFLQFGYGYKTVEVEDWFRKQWPFAPIHLWKREIFPPHGLWENSILWLGLLKFINQDKGEVFDYALQQVEFLATREEIGELREFLEWLRETGQVVGYDNYFLAYTQFKEEQRYDTRNQTNDC